jgi:hypothetical protein
VTPNVRQCGVWICCGGPDEFCAAPDQKAVAGSGQGVFPTAKAELTAACVEVCHLRVPSGLAETLAVLAFEEGFHLDSVLAM